ncbi:MAG: DUF4062 domain-containing protein [Planctomycetes bacterium]|nr:DUF4062 domain-containing protein [Planctomycetota bacterium]
MAENIKHYKIFISSPSGLEAEYTKLKKEIDFYNTHEVEPEGLSFKVIYWKDIAPSQQNSQELIDPHLCACDFYILVLHNRWGTPPGGDSKYSSGSEHELNIAHKCKESKEYPMKDIAVFFKKMTPNERRRKEGKKVCNFMKRLKESKKLHIQTFRNIVDFHNCIRKCLAKWRLEITGKKRLPEPPKDVRDFLDENDLSEMDEVRKT